MGKANEMESSSTFSAICGKEREQISDEICKFLTYQLLDKQDKRKSPRIPVCFPTNYLLYDGKKWNPSEQTMHALNLSSTGMKAMSSVDIPINTFLYVKFSLVERTPIQASAQVKWAKSFEKLWFVGLTFTELKQEQQIALLDYVSTERSKWFAQLSKQTGKDRRVYFRAPSSTLVSYNLYTDSRAGLWKPQPNKLSLIDVCANGVRFKLKQRLPAGSIVSFSFPLGKNSFPVVGKIVWAKLYPDGLTYHGLQFMNLKEEEREVIIKFVLQEQQLQLKASMK